MISAVLELRIEEQVDHIDRKSRSDDTRAHAEDVRIVVQTGEACAERIRAARRADPVELVRRDRHSDTGSADEDRAIAFSREDRAASRSGIIGIITAFLVVGAEITEFDAARRKVEHQLVLERESRVIARECYGLIHQRTTSRPVSADL